MKNLLLLLCLVAAKLFAMNSLVVPKALEDSQIIDKAGEKIPDNLFFTDQDGHKVNFSNIFFKNNKLPTVLLMGYYECPMLCTIIFNAFVDTIKKTKLKAGKDFRIASVSIDPKETHELAKLKQKNYMQSLGIENEDWWTFYVGEEDEIKKLALAIGFNYYYDQRQKQYAHGAGLFVLSPEGVLSRTLFGINFNPMDLKLALSDATSGKIGSMVDKIILSCFHYIPDSHRYGLYIFGLMRLCGVITILIIALILAKYFIAERRRSYKGIP